jgi:hypothetical protein
LTKEPPAGNYPASGLCDEPFSCCRHNRYSAAERHSQCSHIRSNFVYKNHNKMKSDESGRAEIQVLDEAWNVIEMIGNEEARRLV